MKPLRPVVTNVDIGQGRLNDRHPVNHFSAIWRYRVPDISWALLLSLLLLVAPTCRATSIVFFWTPDQIVIAADSMISHQPGVSPTEGCKILHIGQYYYAAAGLFEDTSVGFDLPGIIRDINRYATPDSGFFAQSNLTFGRLMIALNDARLARKPISVVSNDWPMSGNYTTHYLLMAGIEPATNEVRVGYDAGSVFQSTTTGSFVEENNERLQCPVFTADETTAMKRRRVTYNRTEPTFCWRAMGQREAIFNYVNTHPAWLRFDLVSLAKSFIDMEKIDSPATVGFRTAVLTISKNGTTWIEKGPCSE